MVNQLIELAQLSKESQPQIIQLFFDQIEVLRIENERKVFEKLVSINCKPYLIEMYWDKNLVYAVRLRLPGSNSPSPSVLVNRLRSIVASSEPDS